MFYIFNTKNYIINLFNIGSTGSITTIEYESGLLKDLPAALERIAPKNAEYAHHRTWGDDNGRSHIKSTILGPSLTIPFTDGKLVLGTWQQIVVINHDTQKRERKVAVHIIGNCYE